MGRSAHCVARLVTSSFLPKSVNAALILVASNVLGRKIAISVGAPFQVVAFSGMLADERLSTGRAEVVCAFSVPVNLLCCSKSRFLRF